MDVIIGKTLLRAPAGELRVRAARAERVVADIGTGDGKYVYRLARANPTWLCVGIDASAASLRDVSYRASRKPARGGCSNALFVRATLGEIALDAMVDELTVLHPWGTLLDAVLRADAAFALMLRDGGTFAARINASALKGTSIDEPQLVRAYEAIGLDVTIARADAAATSWGARTARGWSMSIEGIRRRRFTHRGSARVSQLPRARRSRCH